MTSLDNITYTARRDHLCAFCGMTVASGTQYVRTQSPGGAQAKKAFQRMLSRAPARRC